MLACLCLLAGCAAADPGVVAAPDAPTPAKRALARTHAHNDYLHDRPLVDALSHGFASVEADVHLAGTDLRVAHDPADNWSVVPTLQGAYLTPLRDLKRKRNNGGIYADGTPLILLVDIKTEAEATYARLHEVLAEYQSATPGLFTTYRLAAGGRCEVAPGAVTVIISGNRPRDMMKRQATRYAGYDGRRADVGPDVNSDDGPGFVPLISDNWKTVFAGDLAWDGNGEIPADTRAALERLVAQVHAEGKLLRFWNLPKDGPAVWGPLLEAGVDLINTDDLKGLSEFVASRPK